MVVFNVLQTKGRLGSSPRLIHHGHDDADHVDSRKQNNAFARSWFGVTGDGSVFDEDGRGGGIGILCFNSSNSCPGINCFGSARSFPKDTGTLTLFFSEIDKGGTTGKGDV